MVSFTVVIACVDKHIKLMEQTLESIEKYTIKPDKVIVSMSPRYLDLNLHDESRRLESKFPFLKCLVQDKVTGVGGNYNKCFEDEYVDTDYVTIWGADDFYHPQYFEILNHIIMKHDPSILTHSYDLHMATEAEKNPSLAFNFDVFKKISLDKIRTYNNFFLIKEQQDISRFYSGEYMKFHKSKKEIALHYGMQTLKTHIVKENNFKVGPQYDWKSDTLYLLDAYKKYRDMIYIDEILIQYMPSRSYA